MPDATPEPSKGLTAKEAVPLFTSGFRDFSSAMVASMKEIHALAQDRTTTFLYALGTAVLLLALFLRLQPFGIKVSDMQPAEFITISILAVVLILAATLLRVYEHWVARDANRALGITGARILEKTQDASLKQLERGQEQAIKDVEDSKERLKL